jgi:prevent-host-death family protein
MRRSTGITELKSSLRETLEQVKAGESVLVTDRGEPIARIVPVEPEEERMARLVRSGVVRPPLRPLDESFWTLPRPEDPEGLVLSELLRQRGSHR